MKTITVGKDNLDDAAKCLHDGGLVVFPTETVYGLGADAFNPQSVKNIYKAKGRPGDNPLIVHIAKIDDVNRLAMEIPVFARPLMDKFWPGPMTLIFKKRPEVIDEVTAGLDTVAVRYPSNEIANALIAKSGVLVAAPSANLSGSPSPTVYRHVAADLDGRVDFIIDGDNCEVGLESTVIDVSGNCPVILRPGAVTIEMLQSVVPQSQTDKDIFGTVDKPKCPGMKYTHYSPKADVIVVCGDEFARREYIERTAKRDESGVLVYGGNSYDGMKFVVSAGNNMKEYAKNLFYDLRLFDEHGVKTVYAEFAEEPGIGVAVKNRLYKSAGYNIVNV